MKIDYQNLKEWRSLNKVRLSDLARAAGLSTARVSTIISKGQAFQPEALFRFMKQYGWSHEKMCQLCLNGPPPKQQEIKKYIAIDLDDLQQLVNERTN